MTESYFQNWSKMYNLVNYSKILISLQDCPLINLFVHFLPSFSSLLSSSLHWSPKSRLDIFKCQKSLWRLNWTVWSSIEFEAGLRRSKLTLNVYRADIFPKLSIVENVPQPNFRPFGEGQHSKLKWPLRSKARLRSQHSLFNARLASSKLKAHFNSLSSWYFIRTLHSRKPTQFKFQAFWRRSTQQIKVTFEVWSPALMFNGRFNVQLSFQAVNWASKLSLTLQLANESNEWFWLANVENL